jgi:hypothetical protein
MTTPIVDFDSLCGSLPDNAKVNRVAATLKRYTRPADCRTVVEVLFAERVARSSRGETTPYNARLLQPFASCPQLE